jgi:CheY-like chemotaxis protein
LADTIKASGSALNETLTSVLSYAKINQFERQQNKYRQRRPPDAEWSLPNKTHLPPGPDTDFKGLYVCTNIAMLCEEIASVLEVGQSYDRSIDRRGVTVVVEIDYEENWNFFTESGALRRIALNIIGNALKYTTEGSVIITLAASKIAPGNTNIGGDNSSRRMITLTVKDTGKGISKNFMDNHLFVPFTQEDTTSSHGVGLGMSIVKSLVSLLGGEIKVDSELGKGTEVTVMTPMRLCDCDRGKTEKPALELERRTASLREEHLSVVLLGFPGVVRRALEKFLREWFGCNLLESIGRAQPDVILVEESNDKVASDLERTAQCYRRCSVILSIAMVADILAMPMRPIEGYGKWERIPRPIGPNNLGKALWASVVKLRELRGHRGSGEQDESDHGQDVHGKAGQQSRDDDRSSGEDASSPSRERSKAYAVLSDTANSQNTPLMEMNNRLHELTDTPNESPLSVRSESSATGFRNEDSGMDPLNLRVLVVEDNAVNRKLLGAFLKKYGCSNIQYAENGALAVKVVEESSESFDAIFMGAFLTKLSHYPSLALTFILSSIEFMYRYPDRGYIVKAYADLHTDLSMPVMDGFTATRMIRNLEHERCSARLPPNPITPAFIIALTGLASDRDEDEALAAGVDIFVTKPTQFDKISMLLKQQEARASIRRQSSPS